MVRKVGKIHLSTFNEGDYAEYRIPGIVCTNKNTLLAYCEGRSGGTDWGRIEIILWRSEAPAPGETQRHWSDYTVLVPSVNDQTVNNANMIVDGDTLHFIYHTDYKRVFYQKSTDDGISWSEPKEITYAFDQFQKRKHWVVNASGPSHGIAMKSGRLVMPVWIGGNDDDPHAHWPSCTGVIYSDDRGETWQAGALIQHPAIPSSSEAVLAELSDGSLMINTRNDNEQGLRAVAISRDGGETFEESYFDKQLPDPQCSAGMTQSEGKIYFTNCDNLPMDGDSRINLTLKVSMDDGKTWKILTKIEDRAGYSDVCVDKNGHIYCFYECERPKEHDGSFPQLHLTVFDMEKPSLSD